MHLRYLQLRPYKGSSETGKLSGIQLRLPQQLSAVIWFADCAERLPPREAVEKKKEVIFAADFHKKVRHRGKNLAPETAVGETHGDSDDILQLQAGSPATDCVSAEMEATLTLHARNHRNATWRALHRFMVNTQGLLGMHTRAAAMLPASDWPGGCIWYSDGTTLC